MGKAKGVSRRRRKNQKPRFVHRSKMRRKRNAIIKRPTFQCKTISEAWDKKKSLNANLDTMGLTSDPNKVLPVPKAINQIVGNQDLMEVDKNKTNKNKKTNSKVIPVLEESANKPTDKNFRFGPDVTKFCVYMIEKYGTDYKAMARDKTNYYQESPGQIRQKILKFKSIPSNWNAYQTATNLAENQLDDDDDDDDEDMDDDNN